MIRRAFLAVALTALPGTVLAQAVPQFQFSVRNNTSVALLCEFRIGDGTAETVELAPGSEWRERGASAEATAEVSCRPPAKQVAWRVTPGNRYAFLRKSAQSTVKLRKVGPQ